MQTALSLSTVTATQEQVDCLVACTAPGPRPVGSATATSVVLAAFSIVVDTVCDAE